MSCRDLDVKEWVKFFSSINRNLSAQDSRMVFMKVDKNGDGQVSLNELVPIVFGKATKEQSRAIIDYVESEVIRKHTGSVTLSVGKSHSLTSPTDLNIAICIYISYTLLYRIRLSLFITFGLVYDTAMCPLPSQLDIFF